MMLTASSNLIELAVKGERYLKLSHSAIVLEGVDFDSRSLSMSCEYHIKLSNHSSGDVLSPASAQAGKAVGVAFKLPDGNVDVSGLQMNGKEVPALSIFEDLQNISNFDLSYWCFPESANSEALGKIFKRLCRHRRDLISYEEVSKAHAAASMGQSFGLLVKIPPGAISSTETSLTITLKLSVVESPLFKNILDQKLLATLGEELWFPAPSRIMTLPSGVAVTAHGMEHHRSKCTVKLNFNRFPHYAFVVSGERVSHMYESSWVNLRAMGLFVGQFAVMEEACVYRAFSLLPDEQKMNCTLKKDLVSEILQVLSVWFGGSASLPELNLMFLPLPVNKSFHVMGNTVLLDASVLHREGFLDRKISAIAYIAEAIASVWVNRCMPAFAEPWLPVGISSMIGDRFVEYYLGPNEYAHRLITRKQRFHAMVERGLDHRPLPVIADGWDPLLRLKAALVMDCLRRSVVGDSDLKTAFNELASRESTKKKTVWTNEDFFFLLTCTVGQHTEAGRAIPQFKDHWVKGVGVPLIHVGFSMLEKRKFALNVVQRPLQRVSVYDNSLLCCSPKQSSGVCACGQDFVSRKEEPHGGASYLRPHLEWPGRRRFWTGEIEVSVFRATNFFVPVSVTMEPDLAQQILTVPYVTPRKHEVVLNRISRDDELVHGWLTVTDEKWLLAKVVVCQSPLMWCNKLKFSKNVFMELSALEALQHLRGSALAMEAMYAFLRGSGEVFYRVRQEAGKSLIHLALGCAEREALLSVLVWLQSVVSGELPQTEHAEWLTWFAVAEQLALVKRNADRRDHKAISDLFSLAVKSIENALVLAPSRNSWTVDPHLVLSHAIRFALLSASQDVLPAIDTRLKSDMYGPPLSSPDLLVTEAVLSSVPSSLNWPPWAYLGDPEYLERLCLSSPVRKLSRTAVRSYLMADSASSEKESGSWDRRLRWIEKLTEKIVSGEINSVQSLSWLVDCWELVLERYRRESIKSPLSLTLQKKDMCDRLWTYLTGACLLLPSSIKQHVQHIVVAIYVQAYGLGVPPCIKDCVGQPRGDEGPMSFWLPFKDHERIYRRFMFRGATVKPEKQHDAVPKKPRLLITSSGTVALDHAFSKQ